MRTRIIFLYFLVFACFSCLPINPGVSTDTPSGQSRPPLAYENRSYKESIRTVILSPSNRSNLSGSFDVSAREEPASPAALSLSIQNQQTLLLEFDDLQNSSKDYRGKIIHCTRNWKPSLLNDIEFLNDFNNFPIRQHRLSMGTKVSYNHYEWPIPSLKISGNYLLVVYEGSDEKNLVLSRRFVIYENVLSVAPLVMFSNDVALNKKNQRIQFDISYNGFQLSNPQQDVHVWIRQNYNWQASIQDLKPRRVNDFERKLIYDYFDQENEFLGLNEFRRFDMQSLRFLGFNMATIDRDGKITQVTLQTDRPRGGKAYLLNPDFNGRARIEHFETGRGKIEADYAQVVFRIKAEKQANPVHILGQAWDWEPKPENRLSYDAENGIYQGQLLLKQGEHNYAYATMAPSQKPDFSYWEGNYQQTENDYEIYVYFEPPSARFPRLLGYRLFNSNESR